MIHYFSQPHKSKCDDFKFEIGFMTDDEKFYNEVDTCIREIIARYGNKNIENKPENYCEIIHIDNNELDKINKYCDYPVINPEELFAFSFKLCDNEIDDDNEYFSVAALHELVRLFRGKKGFVADGIFARIYDTELVNGKSYQYTKNDIPYKWIRAKAYMVCSNEKVIKEIKAGIRKEISISCSTFDKRCSICGNKVGSCPHKKGSIYKNGGRCYVSIESVTDAYEWAFTEPPSLSKNLK